jgi:RNase P subunit RPR2
MTIYSKKIKDEDNSRRVIDLATPLSNALAADKRYICPACKDVLVDYPQAQLYNPHAGPSYRCPNCNKIYDSSLEKLPKTSKKVHSSLGREQSGDSGFIMVETVPENAGQQNIQDEYDKYDPEGDSDYRMEMQGWHITESKIELTDRQGNNRTIVKRDKDIKPVTTLD